MGIASRECGKAFKYLIINNFLEPRIPMRLTICDVSEAGYPAEYQKKFTTERRPAVAMFMF